MVERGDRRVGGGVGGGHGGRHHYHSRRMSSTLRLSSFFGVVFLVELLLLVYIKYSSLPPPTPDTGHMLALGSFAPGSPAAADSAATKDTTSITTDPAPYVPPRLPGPLTVACLSSQRTVSTTAFNLVRVLMERVDPNSISGWEHDLIGSKPNERVQGVLPKVHGKVSMVYKSHAGGAEHHKHADFFVVTYRDPYEVMCSMGRMFMPKIFKDDRKAVGKCRKMAENEAGIRYWAGGREGGKTQTQAVHINSDALKSMEGMVEVVQMLMDKWGVVGGELDPRSIAMEVLELESPPEGVFVVANPRSELHPHHITGGGEETMGDCEVLKAVLEEDGVCRAWHDSFEAMFPEGSSAVFDEASPRAGVEGARKAPVGAAPEEEEKDAGHARWGDGKKKGGGKKKGHGSSGESSSSSSSSSSSDAAVDSKSKSSSSGSSSRKAAATVAAPPPPSSTTLSRDPHEKYFYCLLNGGFNDITVEMWKCIQFALDTNRTLVLGYENYNPVTPPWTPYFTLQQDALPTLRTITPFQAATALNERNRHVSIFPPRLTNDLDPLLGPRPSHGHAPEGLDSLQPFPFDYPNLKHLKFRFDKEYVEDVVVFHRQGNVGSGLDLLKNMRFSLEIRRTFLERWSKLTKPYIAMHLRRTDKSCGDKNLKKILKVLHRLGRSGLVPEGPVYVASDHPELPDDFREELEETQGREMVSFTYHPPNHEQRNAKKENPLLQRQKEQERHSLGLEGLHLHDDLSPAEKHQTNLDAFVDLLLLAMAEELVTSCGGYSRLAGELHEDPAVVLSLLGLPMPGPGEDMEALLEAAAAAEGEVTREE